MKKFFTLFLLYNTLLVFTGVIGYWSMQIDVVEDFLVESNMIGFVLVAPYVVNIYLAHLIYRRIWQKKKDLKVQ